MNIKIGDFGLATREEFEGERERYTLLVGRPPFETSSLRETYQRIKKNQYHIPSRVSMTARNLISQLLHKVPAERPDVMDLLKDDFFTSGHLPKELPTSCLTTAPRFTSQINRKPLSEVPATRKDENTPPLSALARRPLHKKPQQPVTEEKKVIKKEDVKREIEPLDENPEEENDIHLATMKKQLLQVMEAKPCEKNPKHFDESEDPAAVPFLWVSKWVDYSDKYGLGYQLNDGSVGVLFNDTTRLLLHQNQENLEYIDREWNESYPTMTNYPESLKKKVTLLTYFRSYMTEHLLKTGAAMTPRESDDMVRLPYLNSWFRTRSAIVLHLSNGTMQVNFFNDHTKIIVCPLMGAVTYIDEKRDFHTYRCQLIKKYGCIETSIAVSSMVTPW